ncbi:MAG: hypothetical protein LC623_00580, partial [Halobacteriales archaeon]|nr:hypothetical protein [Halobacteriales archaeon]
MAPTRAALTARILLAALALAAGTAAATVHQDAGRFGLPAVHAGDRWAYNVTSLDGAVELPDGGQWLQSTFERSAAHAAADATGAWHAAQTLTERRVVVGRDDAIVRHEVAAAATLASTQERHGGGRSTTTATLPNNLTAADREQETQWTWWTAYGSGAPCGHASSLQGTVADPAQGVAVAGECGGNQFHSLGRTAAGLLVVSNGPTTLWLSPACPVPVRIERPLPWNQTRTLVWNLTGFSPGEEGVPAAPALPAPLPPLATQPGDRPLDGLPLAFPLDEALKVARASGPLADFERSHPGAFLRRASVDERVDDTAPGRARSVRWDLESTDGHTAARVRASRTWTSPLADDSLERLVRGTPVPPQDDVALLKASLAPYPPVAPASWPTV